LITTKRTIYYKNRVFLPNLKLHAESSDVSRKFSRGRPSFVTIVWRHKSTLVEVPKARPF